LYGFTFSPDGKILAAVGKDCLIAWDTQNGKLRYQVKAKLAFRLAFSRSGKYLACGGYGKIRLLEAATGKNIRVLQPFSGYVHDLTFSPDDKRLASVQEYVVRLWDLASGKRLLAFPGNESPVESLAFSRDGASLAAGDSETGMLTVWDEKNDGVCFRGKMARPGSQIKPIRFSFATCAAKLLVAQQEVQGQGSQAEPGNPQQVSPAHCKKCRFIGRLLVHLSPRIRECTRIRWC
jgi:WD40 repeat protein